MHVRSTRTVWLVIVLSFIVHGCGGGGGDNSAPAVVTTYAVGGTVSGFSGSVMVLQNNGGDSLAITTNGTFTFATELATGAAYSVTVQIQPAAQACLVSSGSGTIAGANVTNVTVSCADSGSLDPSFGSAGLVINDSAAGGNGFDVGNAIALDSSGRILVAGQSNNAAGNSDMVIWRYNADGTPDTTFGTSGIVIHDNAAGGAAGGNAADFGFAIVLDSSGRILVAGQSINAAGNLDMVIWRYNADGTPDTTFGTNGIVVSHNAAGGNHDDVGKGIALDAGGKILVTGHSTNAAGNSDMVIWRYNADGTPDGTFDTDGITKHDSAAGGNGDDFGRGIAVDPNGKIVVTGGSWNATAPDMVIWRYNADGTPDTTFNFDGKVVHNNAAGGNGDDTGNAVVLDSSGRIVVSGYSWKGASNYDMAVWRYNADGTPDATFGTNGIAVHNNAAGGAGFDFGAAIALDAGGRIVVAGRSDSVAATSGATADMVIWRYKPDGTLDTSFDTDGIVVNSNAAGGSGSDSGNAVAVDSSGRIAVAGNSRNAADNNDLVIWRYNP